MSIEIADPASWCNQVIRFVPSNSHCSFPFGLTTWTPEMEKGLVTSNRSGCTTDRTRTTAFEDGGPKMSQGGAALVMMPAPVLLTLL